MKSVQQLYKNAIEDNLFDNMQYEGYDRKSGFDALVNIYEHYLADAWLAWWDEGED